MNKTIWILSSIILIVFASCKSKESHYSISVNNKTSINRNAETVEIWFNQLENFNSNDIAQLAIIDKEGNELMSQLIDDNQDQINDYIIFQVSLKANEEKHFKLVKKEGDKIEGHEPTITTFCRFVPERMDDFAWENDKVAFRTYGPECQRLFEEGNPNGLISSGIDCWLKRVDYPIINKWYAKNAQGKSYHVDEGEGLDNYHVGTTRGCGGTAIQIEENLYFSANFTKWKIITNGPIRSIFELEYAPILVDKALFKEKKRFTIDLGSNFYQCEVTIDGSEEISSTKVGITLHNGSGEVNASPKKGWFSYWEPLDDSHLGTGILINQDNAIITDIHKDNHLWASIAPVDNKYTFWAGFGWKKAGIYTNQQDWEKHLQLESEKRNKPLLVKVKKE